MAANEKFSAFLRKMGSATTHTPYLIFVSESNEELNEVCEVIRTRLTNAFGAVDEVHLSGLDHDAASWHAELLTVPMFPTGRLILVRHAEALLKRIESQPKVLATYATDLAKTQPFVTTILQMAEKKISKKLQVIEDLGQLYEEMPAGPEDIALDLLERCGALGYKVNRDTIELLVERSAGQRKIAAANFDKLITYKLHEKEIREEDVLEVTEQSESNLHFRLLDETARRNIPACLQILERHSLDAAEALVAALAKLFGEALRFMYYRESGMQLADIGKILTARPLSGYALKKTGERCSMLIQKYSPQGIERVLEALVKADLRCKENSATSEQQVIITGFYLMLSKSS